MATFQTILLLEFRVDFVALAQIDSRVAIVIQRFYKTSQTFKPKALSPIFAAQTKNNG
jgi:hypothetical protein